MKPSTLVAVLAVAALARLGTGANPTMTQAAAAAAAAAGSFDAKMAEQAKNLHKFMPNPTGPGFMDKGMTGEAEFAQMDRFGIPDLNNPMAADVTDLNFDTVVGGDKYTGVLFYAPSMADFEFYALHWEKAAMELKDNTKVYTPAEIGMARLDIAEPEHADLAAHYGVSTSTPTMLLFYNGTVVSRIHGASMGHADIRQYIIAQTLPSISELTSDAEVKKWKRRKVFNQANVKLLGFFPHDNDDRAAFHAIATTLKPDGIQCAFVAAPALLATATGPIDAPSPGHIYLIRDFDAPRVVPYPGEGPTAADLVGFVHDYNMPLLTHMGDPDESKVRNFLQHDKTFRVLVFFKSQAAFEAAKPDLETVARTYRSNSVLVGYTIEDPEDAMNFDYQFWDVPSDKPAILVVHMRRDRKYLYTGDDAHDVTTMQTFVADAILHHKIEPKLKSQTPPMPNNGLVRVLVTNSLEREVFDTPDQDSLVLLTRSDRHRPSQWFARQLDKFAKVWRREKRLLIAKMDMNLNDWTLLGDDELRQLPKLIYVSTSMKAQGPSLGVAIEELYPTMEDLMTFVQTHQTMDLAVDDKVWTRVLAEDKELLRKHHEAKAGAPVEHPGDILKEIQAEIQAMQQEKDEL